MPSVRGSSAVGSSAFKAILLAVGLAWGIVTAQAQATRYVDLHDFGGTITNADGKSGPDGEGPQAPVVFDTAGNMYGTASVGGPNTLGIVWEYTTAKKYIDLHDFGGTVKNADGKMGPDGGYSQAGVTVDTAGNLYGTASTGGPNGFGMVWEITKAGTYLDLHDFGGTVTTASGKSGPDGLAPYDSVTFDSNGNMYGTASGGGPRYNGMVWEITKAGVYHDLHDFGNTILNADDKSGPDGADPDGGIVFDTAGDMYGATALGGPYDASEAGDGMVWEITKAGVYVDLHDFGGTTTNADGKSGPDGYNPTSSPVITTAGNLYGTAANGGANDSGAANARGIVWEITKAGAYHDLHDFGGVITNASGTSSVDGGYPAAGVVFDTSGNMFGTTENGGDFTFGICWEITSGGAYRDLHDFGGNALTSGGTTTTDGAVGGQVIFYAGNLYGTNLLGGAYDESGGGDGIVWELGTSVDAPTLTINPTSVPGTYPSAGTVNLAFPLATPLTVNLTSSSVDAQVHASVTIPADAKSASFTIKTSAVPANVTARITASVVAVEGTVSSSATLTVEAPVLSKFFISPTTVTGGSSATVYALLSSPAPTGGYLMTMSTSSPAVAKIPASTTVAAGATKSPTFAVTTVPVATNTPVTITVKSGGYVANYTITVDAPYLYSLTLSPTSVTGGAKSTGTITINAAAPTGGLKVTLTSSSKSATVPATVTIPAGKTSATFTVTTTAVTTQTTSTIKTTFAGILKTEILTIKT